MRSVYSVGPIAIVLTLAFALPLPLQAETETLNPDGSGSPTDWSLTGAATDHAATSDSNDSSFIHLTGTAVDVEHLLAVSNPTFDSGSTINSVTVWIRARVLNGSGGPEKYDIRLKSGATTGEVLKTANDDTFLDQSNTWNTNPDDSQAWEFTDLAGIQAGVQESILGNSEKFEVAKVWVVVDYTPPGITVSPTSGLTTTEAGGTDTFTVVLDEAPSANVVIGISSNDTGEGQPTPTSLTFTTGNWSTPQTVTVTGQDDVLIDGDIGYTIITAAATSSDTSYNGMNADDVSVTNTDDDVASPTWDGSEGNNWNTPGNWASNSVPGPGDDVVFDAGSVACTVNANVDVASITVNGYSGTITVNSSITIDVSGNAVFTTGTFNGSTGNIDINGSLTIDGGTFKASSATTFVGGAFTYSSGTFTHNSGTVVLDSTTNQTFTPGSADFYDLNINSGLVGYWKLDYGSSTTAYDSSGYGNDGTFGGTTVNPSWDTNVPEKITFTNPYSIDCTGSGDTSGEWVEIPHSDSLDLTSSITMAVWIKLADLSDDYMDIISKKSDYNGSGYAIDANPSHTNGGRVQLYGNGTAAVADGVPFTTGWHHLAGTISGTTGKIYFDGVMVNADDTTMDAITSNTLPIQIGRKKDAGTDYNHFNGKIDDVRIYNRVLTAQEISLLAAGTQPGTSAVIQTLTGSSLDVNNNLTLSAGTLDTNGQDLTVAGGWINYGGAFTAGTRKVTFDGASGTHSILCGGQDFHDIDIGATSSTATWQLLDPLEVSGSFTIIDATFDGDTNQKAVVLSATGSETVTMDGKAVYDLDIRDDQGPCAYYKFDEGSGTFVTDHSGNGNSAHLPSDLYTSSSASSKTKFPNTYAVDMDSGSTHYAKAPFMIDPSVDHLTACAWINFTSDGTDDYIFDQSDEVGTTGRHWLFINDDTNPAYLYSYLGGNMTGGDAGAKDWLTMQGEWHHVALTYDGTTKRIYIDGALEASEDYGVESCGGYHWIGNNWQNTASFDGLIDEVRFYKRALSNLEIATLANGYHPNSGTGTQTLADAATVNNDLILSSGNLALGSNNLTVKGHWTNQGGILKANTGTVTFNNTTNGTRNIYSNGHEFHNVAIGPGNDSSDIWKLLDDLYVNGSFTCSGDADFQHNSKNVYLTGTDGDNISLDGETVNDLHVGDSLSRGLLAYYRFDDGTGSSTAADASGNGKTATLVNTPTWTASSCSKLTYANSWAIELDGNTTNDQFVRTPFIFDPAATNFTACMWVYIHTTGTEQMLISQKAGTGQARSLLYIDDTLDTRSYIGGADTIDNTNWSTMTNQWHHVGVTYDGTNVRLYVDGVNTASSAQTAEACDGEITLGIRFDEDTDNVDGVMDEVRFYNRALSPEEFEQLTLGTHPSYTTASHTISGTVGVDNDLIINNGTLNGGTGSLTVAYDWTNYGGIFEADTGSVTFNGTTNGTYPITNLGQAFHNLTIGGASSDANDIWQLTDDLYVSGSFTVANANVGFDRNSKEVFFVPTESGRELTMNGNTLPDLNIGTGLVGYWKFDTGSGSTVTDYSGYGNNGEFKGEPSGSPAWDSGVPSATQFSNDNCLDFVTSVGTEGDYVEIPNSPSLAISGDITIAVWFMLHNTTDSWYPTFVSNRLDDWSPGYACRISPGNDAVSFQGDSWTPEYLWEDNIGFTANKWHHIAFSVDGSTCSLYFDGKFVVSEEIVPITSNSNPVLIGCQNGNDYFNGKMDDLRIYNRPLSAVEIATLAAGKPGGGDIAIGAGTLTMQDNLTTTGDVNVRRGTLEVGTGNTLQHGGTAVNVESGGGLKVAGTSASNAIFTTSAASFNLNISGTLECSHYQISKLGSSGIVVNDGATILDLNDGTLDKASGLGGPILDLSAVTGEGRLGMPRSVKGITFGSSGTNEESIKSGSSSPVLYLYDYTDNTTDKEDDPYNRIHWMSDIVKNMDTSTTYDSLEDAYTAATAGDNLRVVKNCPINEHFTLTKNAVIEEAIFVGHKGGTILDDNNNNYVELRNCVILQGDFGVDKVVNCTFHRIGHSASSTYTLDCNTLTNTLIENGAWTLDGTPAQTTNHLTADDTYYVAPALYDFHLKSITATDNNVIDKGTLQSWTEQDPDFRDMDGEGRPFNTTWDIGADEYQGTTSNLVYFVPNANDATLGFTAGQVTDLGCITRLQTAYKNPADSEWYAWIFSGRGASNSARDNRIYVVRYRDNKIMYWSDTLEGTPSHYASYRTGTTPNFTYYVYVVVDTNDDGYGDSVQALYDNRSSFTIDSNFGSQGAGNAQGLEDFGANGDGDERLKWVTQADVGSEGRRLFFVFGDEGDTKLYKWNCQFDDDDAANSDYGEQVWVLTTERSWSWEGGIQWVGGVVNKMYVPLSDDTNDALVVRVPLAGTSTPSIEAAWDLGISDALDTQNNLGAALSKTGSEWILYVAPSDGNQLLSTMSTAATSEERYLTAALGGGGSATCTTFPLRFVGSEYVLLGVGNYLEKVEDNGNTAVWATPSPLNEAGRGLQVSGETNGIFPLQVNGKIVYWVLRLGTKIYWATDEGWVYRATWRDDLTDPTSEVESVDTGFPMYLGARAAWIYYHPLSEANGGGVYVGTEEGGVVKIPLE